MMSLIDAERRNFLIGIGLLLVVVFEWTGSSFLTQGVFDGGYEKAFLLTYLNTSAFSLYLVPFAIQRLWNPPQQPRHDSSPLRPRHMRLPTDVAAAASGTHHSRSLSWLATRGAPESTESESAPLTTRETAELASVFCFFWFIANYAVNASLDYTTVASSTILSSMSGFFTLGIGRAFGVERFSLGKLGAVIISFIGVLLVSLEDTAKETALPPSIVRRSSAHGAVSLSSGLTRPADANPPLGDFFAILSAVFYALYVTLLKLRIRDESRINMQLFFGFVGLFNIIALAPVGVLLHFTGVEPFEWPTSAQVWVVIGINMFMTLSSDYIYLIAMLKTTPLIVTVGLALTIPLAVIGDLVFLHIGSPPQTIFGAMLVVLSFFALGFEGRGQVVEEPSREEYETIATEVEEEDLIERSRGRSVFQTKGLSNTSPVRYGSITIEGRRSDSSSRSYPSERGESSVPVAR